MKVKIVLSIILVLLMIAPICATDIYNINDVRNLETSIHMQDKPINAYIDYRDINEAPSGGYFEESKELLLPHDLGLGKHRLEIETENGIKGYDFYVVKGDEDISIYEGYTPYYYENDIYEDEIEEDYATFNALYNNTYEDNDITYEITDDNILIKKIIVPAGLTKVNVKLGIINDIDNSLTSVKI